MLEEKDLHLIKRVVQEVIEEDVVPHFIDVYDRFENIDQRFENIDQRFENIDQRLETIESTMVTKDYLESRLADFRKALKQSGGRALTQIKGMAKILHRNGVLSPQQVVEITAL